jgi:hypothetical protein
LAALDNSSSTGDNDPREVDDSLTTALRDQGTVARRFFNPSLT